MENELEGGELLAIVALFYVTFNNNWQDFLATLIVCLSTYFLLWITSEVANTVVRCVLIICGFLGVLALLKLYSNELRDFSFILSNSIYTIRHFNLEASQVDIRFYNEIRTLNFFFHGLKTSIYNYEVKFVKTPAQLLNYVYNLFSWFYAIVIQLVNTTLGTDGIIGIAILLFAIIVIKLTLVWQQFDRLSEKYTRCVEDHEKLQLKLEDIILKLKNETNKLNEDLEKLRSSNLSLEQERDDRLCGICQDQIKTIVLLPCQHMCLCKQCLDHRRWKKCPMCRKRVESTMEVYV